MDDNNDKTFFAPPERADKNHLQQNIALISQNPVVNTILKSVSGLLAVLNEQRQILIVNPLMLESLGVDSAKFGLRFGEAIDCIHAHDHLNGCGTGPACPSCGAAIAIVTCQKNNEPAQQNCFITLERQGHPVDYYFQVQCSPIALEGQRFLLLFLTDMTISQRHAALERAFFHDVKNIVASLLLTTDILARRVDDSQMHAIVVRHKEVISRLSTEIEIQRLLSDDFANDYQVMHQAIPLDKILADIRDVFSQYSDILHVQDAPALTLNTDLNLLRRVLTNMVINALEASKGDEVRLWVEPSDDVVTFCVWNRVAIPKQYALRIFQRNFSTKGGSGRGLGTYIMKMIGETYLGGTVTFTSSEQEGTVFRLTIPLVSS